LIYSGRIRDAIELLKILGLNQSLHGRSICF